MARLTCAAFLDECPVRTRESPTDLEIREAFASQYDHLPG
jgi:hypothetical protein